MSQSASWIYRSIRPLLFALDAERAHRLTLGLLHLAEWVPARARSADPRLRQRLWDLDFRNPIGLAAGLDKDAMAHKSFVFMGLGFIEVGTVTPLPQPGNPPPRLLRHVQVQSLQNWLGFNNRGLEAMRRRLSRIHPAPVPIGVNIGKNKSTPDDRAEEDYSRLVEGLTGRCDYFVVNVSSPNTPGLRDLQEERRLRALVELLRTLTDRPILVKLAPDLAAGEAARLAGAVLEGGASGLVLCNTTTAYDLVPGAPQTGGLSGRVLTERSYEVLREVAAEVDERTVLISVGGIDSGQEVWRRLRAGARLVQIYSGLIFNGPGLPRRIERELLELMERDGVPTIDDLVGVDR